MTCNTARHVTACVLSCHLPVFTQGDTAGLKVEERCPTIPCSYLFYRTTKQNNCATFLPWTGCVEEATYKWIPHLFHVTMCISTSQGGNLVMLKCTYISELFLHKTKDNTVITLLEVNATSSCLLDTWLVGWLTPNVPDHAVLVGQWYLCRGPLRSCSRGVEGAWHFPPSPCGCRPQALAALSARTD